MSLAGVKCPLCDHAEIVSVEDEDVSLSEMFGHIQDSHKDEDESALKLLARVTVVMVS